MLLRSAILFAAAAVDAVAASGCSGFAGTCGRAYARNGTSGRPDADMVVFATYCLDEGGNRHYNPAVLINDCLANTFGQLTGGTGFAHSCRDFGIDPIGAPNFFHATCGDGRGNEKQSQIDLNQVLCNVNGNLACSQ
ncbi:hypothetical protein V2A60_003550 [Cordyceps javanica]|uniref:CVNHdomain-containing protein n=1 Tax=Cordyceps javanica TaxID=43265 RepID=A0A545UUJ8_9HYPO|nr:CVNHdomain-containing protein [Cordyceps javanica]TQW05039.1 CVNH domain-containing protein [Cordyceps javanica]